MHTPSGAGPQEPFPEARPLLCPGGWLSQDCDSRHPGKAKPAQLSFPEAGRGRGGLCSRSSSLQLRLAHLGSGEGPASRGPENEGAALSLTQKLQAVPFRPNPLLSSPTPV